MTPRTQIIICEGVMGTGKSTLAAQIAAFVEGREGRVRLVPEGGEDNPLRLILRLEQPFRSWRCLEPEAFADQAARLWEDFAHELRAGPELGVVDGLLLHGNLSELFLMDASEATMQGYITRVGEALRDLSPVILYAHLDRVPAGIAQIAEQRGWGWQLQQIAWKMESPYAQRHGLSGRSGLGELYARYQALCERLLAPFPARIYRRYPQRAQAPAAREAELLEILRPLFPSHSTGARP